MSKLNLDEIETRAKAATPGPWRPHNDVAGNDDIETPSGPVFIAKLVPVATGARGDTIYDAVIHCGRDADLDFAAAAREDVPALVARVRELEAVLREAIDGDGGLSEYRYTSADGDEFNNEDTIALIARIEKTLEDA